MSIIKNEFEPSNEAKWVASDSTVQAYRSNFLASQSFLLAVGAILLGKSALLVFLVAGLALLSIWYIWFRVITIRKRVADYYQFGIGDRFNITSTQYIKDKEKRRDVYNAITDSWDRSEHLPNGTTKKEKFKTNRLTRLKLDIFIPIIMTLVWVGFIINEFINLLI